MRFLLTDSRREKCPTVPVAKSYKNQWKHEKDVHTDSHARAQAIGFLGLSTSKLRMKQRSSTLPIAFHIFMMRGRCSSCPIGIVCTCDIWTRATSQSALTEQSRRMQRPQSQFAGLVLQSALRSPHWLLYESKRKISELLSRATQLAIPANNSHRAPCRGNLIVVKRERQTSLLYVNTTKKHF